MEEEAYHGADWYAKENYCFEHASTQSCWETYKCGGEASSFQAHWTKTYFVVLLGDRVKCSTVLDGSMAFDERVDGCRSRCQAEESRIDRIPFRLTFKMAAMGMEVREEVSMYCDNLN